MQQGRPLRCAMLILAGCGHAQVAQEAVRSRPANSLRQVGMASTSDREADQTAPTTSSVNLHRKVIFDAEVTLIANDFTTIENEIPKLVRRSGGYLADVSVDRTQGAQRVGRWQARIPVDHFDSFLDSVSELGIPENRRQEAVRWATRISGCQSRADTRRMVNHIRHVSPMGCREVRCSCFHSNRILDRFGGVGWPWIANDRP